MVTSKATTVTQYLSELPAERREVIAAVRAVLNKRLPKGYVESMDWGMISYEIPLARFPDTYNGRPLMYAALAAQKNNYAIYLMGVYGDPTRARYLADAFRSAGKKLDMGKSCIRFNRLEDIPLEAIGEVISQVSVDAYLAHYLASRGKSAKPKRAATAGKTPKPKSGTTRRKPAKATGGARSGR